MTAEVWKEGLKKYARAAAQWATDGGNGAANTGAVNDACLSDDSGDEWGGYW